MANANPSDPLVPVKGLTLSGSWLEAPFLQHLLSVLNNDGEQALLVGGTVRNAVCGRPVTDMDVATTALPQTVIERVEAAGHKTVPTGIEHGTITAVSGDETVEITTLREDVATDGRRAVVSFGRSWHADAARRDFTMNAMYCAADGTLFDPLGGLEDCRAGIVRFVGDADRRLVEDRLRLLRFFRFHAQYGRGHPDAVGLSACIRARRGLVELSAERLQQEVRKLLAAPGAAPSCRLVAETGIAQIVFGTAPNPPALRNLIELCDGLSEPVHFETALAAFTLHGPDHVDDLTRRLRLSNNSRSALLALAELALVEWRRDPARDGDLIEAVIGHGKSAVRQAILLASARLAGRVPSADRMHRVRSTLTFVDQLSVPVFPLRGRDLLNLGVAAGPDVGRLLERARMVWRDGDYQPDGPALIRQVRQWIDNAT
ncbi:MAG: CCA tRNA nucleotidyltransferase [Pseudomonadota bacterium]